MREVRALTDKGKEEMRGMLVGLFGRTPAPGDLSKHPAGSTSANTCRADDRTRRRVPAGPCNRAPH